MKAFWINDIHLEFLDRRRRGLFLGRLSRSDAGCILIAGDIGQAPSVIPYPRRNGSSIAAPHLL